MSQKVWGVGQSNSCNYQYTIELFLWAWGLGSALHTGKVVTMMDMLDGDAIGRLATWVQYLASYLETENYI